jgi:hypothetical protein
MHPIQNLRETLRKDKAAYERASALLGSAGSVDDVKAGVLSLVRLYKIGDPSDKAIGILAAARQLLQQIDAAEALVIDYELCQARLRDLEDRSEEPTKK